MSDNENKPVAVTGPVSNALPDPGPPQPKRKRGRPRKGEVVDTKRHRDEMRRKNRPPEGNADAAEPGAVRPVDDLTTLLTCGDYGGSTLHTVTYTDEETGEQTTDQVPDACDRPSSFGIPGARYGITPGRCYRHRPEALAAKAQQKAVFLEAYCAEPQLGIVNAATLAGVRRETIYLWANKDPEFAKNFQALRELADMILTDMVEEAAIERLLDPKSGADTLRMWYLQNRRSEKWKSAGKTGETVTAPAASFTGGRHVHVWKMGDQILEFPD